MLSQVGTTIAVNLGSTMSIFPYERARRVKRFQARLAGTAFAWNKRWIVPGRKDRRQWLLNQWQWECAWMGGLICVSSHTSGRSENCSH